MRRCCSWPPPFVTAWGVSADVLWEDFGAFLAEPLLAIYGSLVDPTWRTLELLQHTEETIHKVVRMHRAGAAPPRLEVERTASDEACVTYTSARRLCALARGIIRGVAAHYGEEVAIDQPLCMHRGDSSCLIRVKLVS